MVWGVRYDPRALAACSRRQFGVLALGAIASAAGVAQGARGVRPPRPSDDGEAFLREQARRLVDSALVGADDPRNRTGRALRVPGGNMGYPAFWVRDAAMMLGGEFVGAEELEGWIRLVCSTIPGPED